MLANGRCSQDSYYLVPVDETIVKQRFSIRYEKRVEDVIPLKNTRLLVFFRNGKVKSCDIGELKKEDRFFKPVLASEGLFQKVAVQTGGYGVF